MEEETLCARLWLNCHQFLEGLKDFSAMLLLSLSVQ